MKKLKNLSLIHWLLIVTFLKGIIFMLTIPIWHAPDEQAHFAQLQYIAEFSRERSPGILSTSKEVLISERLLGTERDGFGKNKFTHNPGFRIQYTDIITGKYENLIAVIPHSDRTEFVKKEATLYPPLFYFISALFYRSAYSFSLITRVMATRIPSVLMGTAMVYFSYKLAKLVFPKNQLASITAAMMVSFQPMFSFLTSGINSDNLMNPLFAVLIYFLAKVIASKKLTTKLLFNIILTTILLKLTKPHWVIALPITFSLVAFFPKKVSIYVKKRWRELVIGLSGVIAAVIVFKIPLPAPEVTLLPSLFNPNFPEITFSEHLIWTLRHTYAEVIPWYWGVFNWLGVTLPRLTNRLINRGLILALIGLAIWLIKSLKQKKFNILDKIILFLSSSNAIYFIVLMLWDWMFRRQRAFSFGMQGRYYFPLLSAQMILILWGLVHLIPKKYRNFESMWLKLIGLAVILLNFIGLHTLFKAYYQLSPVSTLLTQLSQYKPVYFKTPWVTIWFAIYFFALLKLVIKYLKYAIRPRGWS